MPVPLATLSHVLTVDATWYYATARFDLGELVVSEVFTVCLSEGVLNVDHVSFACKARKELHSYRGISSDEPKVGQAR